MSICLLASILSLQHLQLEPNNRLLTFLCLFVFVFVCFSVFSNVKQLSGQFPLTQPTVGTLIQLLTNALVFHSWSHPYPIEYRPCKLANIMRHDDLFTSHNLISLSSFPKTAKYSSDDKRTYPGRDIPYLPMGQLFDS